MLTEQNLRLFQLSQPKRYYISEGLLFENPNQAIKFLKEKNLDPQVSQEGKKIFDTINNITRGDGYTNLLTRFHVNEKMPIDDIKKLYDYLKQNKQHVNRLPKPVVTYDTYRELRRDLDSMEEMRTLKKLYDQLPSYLKNEAKQLDARSNEKMKQLAADFLKLKPEQQNFFISKVRGYQNIREFMNSLEAYITQIQSGDDYDAIKAKIENTTNAHLVLADPEINVLIAHINSYDASKTLGCTSQWCIARDLSYWRLYKKGGNKYFYIWDFNYPVDDNRYMVATAYRPNNPESSTTHLKDDRQTNLDTIVKNKNLSYGIFNNYLVKHKEEYLKSLENSTGLLKALRDYSLNTKGSKAELLEVIGRSNFVAEHTSPDKLEIYYGRVEFGMTNKEMKNALDLDDEYDTVSSMASEYVNYYSADSDELNHMQNILNDDNINKIKEIAKKLGVPQQKIDGFAEEDGALNKFLEQHDMEIVSETYLSEYAAAENDAENRAAKEQLNNIVFDVEDGSLSIERMLEYMKENEKQFNTFDEFVEDVREGIDISAEAVYESRYNDVDYDNLDSEISDDLDRILDDLDDPDSKYYVKVEAVNDMKQTLKKYGFEYIDGDNVLAKRQQKDKVITVSDFGYPEDDNQHSFERQENEELELKITLSYPDGKSRSGWIPISKLSNYIDQPELQGMREWKQRFNKLIT